MQPNNVFEELIRQFGRRVGLPEMKLDNAGLCRVVLDETVNIDFELSSDGQSLYVYSAMPPIDPKIENDQMQALLAANYSFHRHSKCFMAFDENAREYVLVEVISGIGITLDSLDQILQNFARTATTWHSNCSRGEFGPPKGNDASPEYTNESQYPPFV